MDRHQRAELQQLFERLASGDRRALEPAFGMLWPALRRFARHLSPDDASADDSAQNALLKFFARASELDLERDALTWALGVTAYECKTARKRTQRKRESGDGGLAALHAQDASLKEAAMARELEAAASQVLGTLPAGRRGDAARAAFHRNWLATRTM